jgi:hypothetical protein
MGDLEQLLESLRALPKPERRPDALLTSERFERAVELSEALDDDELLRGAGGSDRMSAATAAEALRRRPPSDALGAALFALLEETRGWRAVFLLRAVLREALALGRHFLGDAALLGALLSLLEGRTRRPSCSPGSATTAAASASPSPGRAGGSASRARIVRRYRERPTPLVRDAVRGWRTGRLDAVLAGGFDLVE